MLLKSGLLKVGGNVFSSDLPTREKTPNSGPIGRTELPIGVLLVSEK